MSTQLDQEGQPIPAALTVRETAAAIRVSKQRIHQLIASGDIEAINLSPGIRAVYRITPEALRTYLQTKIVRRGGAAS